MAGNCKVYTPDNWVSILLDEVGYNRKLFGQRVLENSCGTGNILRRIVERYILDSLKNGYSISQIKSGLEHDITGLEIESESLDVCKYTLDAEAEKYGIVGVKWDLRLCDALTFEEDDYSYVIGNPPYITYHDLSLQQRKALRNEFETCKKGRFDYCYAFIEKSMGNLDEHGVLAYLLPNSILKNVWAEELRTFIQPYLSIREIYRHLSEQGYAPRIIFEEQELDMQITIGETTYLAKVSPLNGASYCKIKTSVLQEWQKRNMPCGILRFQENPIELRFFCIDFNKVSWDKAEYRIDDYISL